MNNSRKAPKKKSRRRRRFGNVTPRPGGSGWLARFSDPTGRRLPSGRRAVITKSVETRAEGEAFLRAVETAIMAGTFFGGPAEEKPPCELTVSDAVAQYIEARRGAGITEATAQIYTYSVKAISRNGVGRKLVRNLTVRDVEQFLGWRARNVWKSVKQAGTPYVSILAKGETASASTIGRDRELLGASLNRLVRLGELDANPVAQVPKPKKPKRTRPVLSKPEIKRLVECCDGHLRPLVLAGLFTGARKSELLRMTWGDVNFDDKTITVTRSKTGNASRLPLAPTLEKELRRVKDERERKRGSPIHDDEPIFLSRFGTVYRSIRTGFNAAVKRAGLDRRKGITPHILRHCFATHFLGVPGAAVSDLQDALGHSSLKTTAIYAAMADERMRKSVEGLDFGF